MQDLTSRQSGSVAAVTMTAAEAAQLVAKVRNNWPNVRWSRARFALWAEALMELPFPETADVVRRLIRTRESDFAPPVAAVTAEVRRELDRRARFRRLELERRLLVEPRSEEVRTLLHRCVERLEAKRARAMALPTRDDPPDRPTIDDQDEIARREARRRAILASLPQEPGQARRSGRRP